MCLTNYTASFSQFKSITPSLFGATFCNEFFAKMFNFCLFSLVKTKLLQPPTAAWALKHAKAHSKYVVNLNKKFITHSLHTLFFIAQPLANEWAKMQWHCWYIKAHCPSKINKFPIYTQFGNSLVNPVLCLPILVDMFISAPFCLCHLTNLKFWNIHM